MLARTVIAAIVSSAVAAGVAHAQDGLRPADTLAELGQVLPTARAAWPNSPCLGHEQIEITDNFPPQAPPGAIGGAAPRYCLVILRPILLQPGWEYGLCITLTHEFGHLAGRDHSSDPTDIMYPNYESIQYEPCWIATRPPAPQPPPGPVPITPDQELQIVQSGEQVVDALLVRRYPHYQAEATCEYEPPPEGDRSPTLTCTAAWRTKKRRYRATVVLREGVENVTVKTGRINARRQAGGHRRADRRGPRARGALGAREG